MTIENEQTINNRILHFFELSSQQSTFFFWFRLSQSVINKRNVYSQALIVIVMYAYVRLDHYLKTLIFPTNQKSGICFKKIDNANLEMLLGQTLVYTYTSIAGNE